MISLFLFLTFKFIITIKVRHIDRGINPPSVKDIYFSGEYLTKGFRIGVIAGLIALTVSKLMMISRTIILLKKAYNKLVEIIGGCSNWKNICSNEGLSFGWKQRNGSFRINEYSWVNDILLCGYWYVKKQAYSYSQ